MVVVRKDGTLRWFYLEAAVDFVRQEGWVPCTYQISAINTESQAVTPALIKDYFPDQEIVVSGEEPAEEDAYFLIVDSWDRPQVVRNDRGEARRFYLEDVIAYAMTNNLKPGHFQFGIFLPEFQNVKVLESLYQLTPNEATRK